MSKLLQHVVRMLICQQNQTAKANKYFAFLSQYECFGLPVGCALPAITTHMLAGNSGQHDLFTACDVILQCNYVA